MENIAARINNLPKDYSPYVVARVVDGELWYWGSWEDEEDAKQAAISIPGTGVWMKMKEV